MHAEKARFPRAFLAACLLSLAACSSSSEEPPGDDPVDDPSDPPTEPPPPSTPPGTGIPITEFRNGKLSPYGTDGSGNCNFAPDPNDMDVAAVATADYAEGALCGGCVEVEGPTGKVRARVVDICPACAPDKLVLSHQAYAKVASAEAAEVDIRWRMVSCAVEGPIRYHLKEGSSQWWAAIQIRNHRLPIQKLEWFTNNEWVPLKRESYNYFTQGSMGPGPQRLRVTASSGQMLEDTLPGLTEGLYDGAAQFDADGG